MSWESSRRPNQPKFNSGSILCSRCTPNAFRSWFIRFAVTQTYVGRLWGKSGFPEVLNKSIKLSTLKNNATVEIFFGGFDWLRGRFGEGFADFWDVLFGCERKAQRIGFVK